MNVKPILNIFVHGIPKPGGSKRAFLIRNKSGQPAMSKTGRPVIVLTDASGKAGKDWRADVRGVAQEEWDGKPLETKSLTVSMKFFMPRPKSHYGTGRNAHVLKDSAPIYYAHLQTPDALKLGRSVEDALTGVIWKDDCILRGWYEKCWTHPTDQPGMELTVWRTESIIGSETFIEDQGKV